MIRFYKPALEELSFRQTLLADEATMSYNAKWGGTIDWPCEKWSAWSQKWLESDEKERFYRYIQNEEGVFVGEAAYRYDEEYGVHVISIIVKADCRGKGYGRSALELLMKEAKQRGITRLCDDIAADNPSVKLFAEMGFHEAWRTEEIVMMEIEL